MDQNEKECGIRDITLGILAGGRSSRMGRDKALLPWRGRPLAEHMGEQLADCGSVLVSAADANQMRGIPYPVVADERRMYGPLEGIYRLLMAARTEWVFIVAADLPLVKSELPKCLLKQLAAEEEKGAMGRDEGRQIAAVVPCAHGRVHPLCGLYHKRAIPILEELFAEGEHRVCAFLDRLPAVYVMAGEHGLDLRMFANVNTPQEYEKLTEMEGMGYESSNYYSE